MKKKGYQEKETEMKKRKRGRFIPWLNKLPQEIVFDIFSRLPVESLLQCKRVLRSWNTLISDPHFINTHLLRASSSQVPDILVFARTKKLYMVSHVGSGHESVKSVSLPKGISSKDFSSFVVSCNGLLAFLIHDHDHHKLFVDIWNPYTKKRTKCPSVVSSPSWNFTACGFGYDPILKEYKVLAFYFVTSLKVEVEVFTVGSTSWRRIKDVPFIPLESNQTVYMNGTLDWIGYQHVSVGIKPVIGSFDVGDEKFRFVAVPPYKVGAFWKYDLSVLGGFLCLLDYSCTESAVLWALKKQYSGEEIWTKQYVLSLHRNVYEVHLLHQFNNGEILLMYNNRCFGYYDPKEAQFRDSQTPATLFMEKNLRTLVHVGSLVSLRG